VAEVEIEVISVLVLLVVPAAAELGLMEILEIRQREAQVLER
jgi:hypothetical protein